MAERLKGKVIVVTGASGNVGHAVVRQFAAAGACLALVDRNADHLARIIQELGGDTECYKGFPADLSDETAVQEAINHIVDQFTQIDGLVHTVGGFAMGKPVHETPMDTYHKMLTLNVLTPFLTCGAVARHMVETATAGSITMILARAGQKGSKNMGMYTATKAAATRLMESMALELRDQRIRVNGISPSIIDTPPNRNDMPNADFEKWVTPRQIAELCVFLQSDESAAITGANIEINGRS